MKLETIAVHAGRSVDPSTGAVTPPIHLSTTFERDADGAFSRGYIYARESNPNRVALERALAALEGGAVAAAFASGQAATTAVLQTLAPGDHVIAPAFVYYGTPKLLRELFARWGLEASYVDMSDAARVADAVRATTKLIWVETPSNPLLTIADIQRIAAIARDAGARCAVDNTWATPCGTRPIDLGADLVMHATTKYLSGHSDVTGGALIARDDDDHFARIRLVQTTAGAIPSPFDCWLAMRGISTLPWRMRAHTANATAVATFLAAHPRVEAVHYPGLPAHPGHDVAAAQMTLFGGMASLQVRGGRDEALAVAGRVRVFTRATSLGGPESLIEHRHSVEGPNTRAPVNLLRMSIGLENAEDLIEDLDQALGS